MAHFLTITRPGDWEFSFECDSRGCDYWMRCIEQTHSRLPDDDEDPMKVQFEHGVVHRVLDGDWFIPGEDCAFSSEVTGPTSVDIAEKHGVGRFEVELEWTDFDTAWLSVVV